MFHDAVIALSGSRAVTLGNKIHLASPASDMGIVAHELTHVGQYQKLGSAAYYLEAGADRVKEWLGMNPYGWKGTPGEWSARFRGMEQEAQIVEDCFRGSGRAARQSTATTEGTR